MRRGPEGTLECPVDADNAWDTVVGPWQYQCAVLGGSWAVPGIAPTQYPPGRTTPGTPPPTGTA